MNKAKLFVNKYYPEAKQIEDETGLSAIAILTQAALESGWGEKVKGNNFFGIKWTGKGEKQLIKTREVFRTPNVKFPRIYYITKRTDGKYDYLVGDWFRSYATAKESFEDHANFLQENKRYKRAWEVRSDYNKFFDEIAKAGYATDPNYASVLKSVAKSVIRRLNLK